MNDINETITDNIINIDFYRNIPSTIVSEHISILKETSCVKKEPSLFIIKRKLPLLTQEYFTILYDKAHNNSN